MRVTTAVLSAAVAAFAFAAGPSQAAETATYDTPVKLDLNFIFHIDQDMAEQDVFVERKPGSGQIYRPTKGVRDMSLPLFAPASPVKHTPFQPDNVGPWKKGRALNVTLGQWFAGKGRGSYTCKDGRGRLKVTFDNLLANGVYTMWHYFLAWPPTKPFIGSYDLPMGNRDGTESVFRTDAKGHAVVERDFKPCLQMTGEHLMSGLAIAWHSDGKTYGPMPGEFSTRSHVHMYVDLPKRSGL
ncbi:MAG: hypothetical protein ACR2PO_08960 [Methyloligellaceae bacterium]